VSNLWSMSVPYSHHCHQLSCKGLRTGADDDCLSVREDGGDCEAAGALDVHEEGSGTWHELLELVLAGFGRWCWVEEIDGENLIEMEC
jgi:hypothetical protein